MNGTMASNRCAKSKNWNQIMIVGAKSWGGDGYFLDTAFFPDFYSTLHILFFTLLLLSSMVDAEAVGISSPKNDTTQIFG
jgi:hypothetical protein